MKKIILLTSIYLLSTTISAENCPSVNDLKSGAAKAWRAYDSDNNKLVSAARELKLKNKITRFSLAEWSKVNHQNRVHCYYTNKDGSDLEAYFAKSNMLSIKPSKYWYEVTDLMQCAAGVEKCEFQTLV